MTDATLKRDLHRLFRSMDFVSRHPVLKRDTAEARRLAEIYQQLGLAWELPRKFLKQFPVILEFDKRRRFTGLTIFKPSTGGITH